MRNSTGGNNPGSPSAPRRSSEPGLYAVPKWEELLADPSKAGQLDTNAARIVAARALGIFAASLYRLLEVEKIQGDETGSMPVWRSNGRNPSQVVGDPEDVTTLEEIARLIGKDRRWMTRNAANLPFVIRLSRKNFVCSRVAFKRWLATRPRSSRNP